MMDELKFYTLLVLIWIAVGLILFATLSLIHIYPAFTSVLFAQALNISSCYALLGLGIGLPLVILASILGWLQLVLLISGNISPHLAKEGLFKVLDTLFSKI